MSEPTDERKLYDKLDDLLVEIGCEYPRQGTTFSDSIPYVEKAIHRVRNMKKVVEASKVLYDHTNRDYDEWREPLYKAIAAFDAKEQT